MRKLLLLVIIFLVILFFLYLPELFPSCACCGKKKPRPFFRIHRAVSLSLGYRGCRSVCTKCCRKHDLKDLKDLDRLVRINRKVRIRQLSDDL
ncbi:MAG TPA: hypothetical protein PK127_09735 [Clostridiales bacterium]|jgi:hypothetical protein|nr:hypothetical protein [Clostridiaceae bacterium]HOQ08156.1 hypothetical protein [Clostridiales bacterium]HPV02741.1 hypothetical protein [Clostridiales bacterium]